jgi:hypothetical protein
VTWVGNSDLLTVELTMGLTHVMNNFQLMVGIDCDVPFMRYAMASTKLSSCGDIARLA